MWRTLSLSYIYNINSSFLVSSDFAKARKVVLIFYGIDTFANVSLNNHTIGQTSNMFLRYIFDVTDYIKVRKLYSNNIKYISLDTKISFYIWDIQEGQNLLQVAFRSAVKVAEDLYNEQRKSYVVPPVCAPREYHGQCHVNHIRKMQASFSWDWGPAFPSVGIW